MEITLIMCAWFIAAYFTISGLVLIQNYAHIPDYIFIPIMFLLAAGAVAWISLKEEKQVEEDLEEWE